MTNQTAGLLARHTPKGPIWRSAALIDIAQDLLLNRLADLGLFEHCAIQPRKGFRTAGTPGAPTSSPTARQARRSGPGRHGHRARTHTPPAGSSAGAIRVREAGWQVRARGSGLRAVRPERPGCYRAHGGPGRVLLFALLRQAGRPSLSAL